MGLVTNSGRDESDLVKKLEERRCEGNELFSQRKWMQAIEVYEDCIHQSLKVALRRAKQIRLLAQSNRAEAWLRVDNFVNALSAATEALKLDATHVKSLVRQGKALFGLSRHAEATYILNAALDLAPHDKIVKSTLRTYTNTLMQAKGAYDLSEYYINGIEPSDWNDFVGPVEVRRVQQHEGGGGRGLVATRDISPGELLILSNAMVTIRANSGSEHDIKDYAKSGKGREEYQKKLTAQVLEKAKQSKRFLHQFYTLSTSAGGPEAEVPSMDLLKQGGEDKVENLEDLEIEPSRISGIVANNCFSDFDQLGAGGNAKGRFGLWLLPSFVNHSCSPNCSRLHVGDVMIIRAAKKILAGEELTLFYFDILQLVDSRQKSTRKHWNFSCQCERCTFEMNWALRKEFKKLGKETERAVCLLAAIEETLGCEREYAKNLKSPEILYLRNEVAKYADTIEKMLQPLDEEIQRDWVRCSHIKVYFSKARIMDRSGRQERSARTMELILDAFTNVIPCSKVCLEVASHLPLMILDYATEFDRRYMSVVGRKDILYERSFGQQTKEVYNAICKSLFLRESTST